MRLVTFAHRLGESFGLADDRGVCDIAALWPQGPRSMLHFLEAGKPAMEEALRLAARSNARLDGAEVKLLAPIPNPPKVIGLAVNYAEHHRESSTQALPDDPRLYTTPRPFIMPGTAICGPGDEIPWPAYSRQIDYEVELAVVIGSRARCVSPAQAPRHIAGYTIANDISARSVTYADGRARREKDDFFDWLHGKWADRFCPIGPCLVTGDELGDPSNLDLELSVNSRVRQKANTSQMIFNVYEIVSFISHVMTLTAGDVIATGTPSGVGMATGDYLSGGDVITCRIERIGELTNTLGQPPPAFYTPCKR